MVFKRPTIPTRGSHLGKLRAEAELEDAVLLRPCGVEDDFNSPSAMAV